MDRLIHIDGLRAVAVVLVLLFHLGHQTFPGGFVGVDVFFVISGFVISRMILAELKKGSFRPGAFLEGRVRRLLPALLATILASGFFASLTMTPAHFAEFARSAIAAILGWSNIYFWLIAGYFDQAAHAKPLLHTWTLSVEWQFYAIWPLALIVLFRLLRWQRIAIIASMGMLSFIATIHFQNEPTTIFYWMPFRIFEFALGALLLWVPPVANRTLNDMGLLLGLALIVAAGVAYDPRTPFPGWYALPPVVGAALVIHAGSASRLAFILTNPLGIWLGRISYSTYLVHWPLIVFGGYMAFRSLAGMEMLAIGLLSIAAGAGLHYFVEVPFWKGAGGRRVVAATGMAAAVVAVLSATASFGGWQWRIDSESLALAADPQEFHLDAYGGAGFEVNKVIRIGAGTPSFILAGDSHALQLAHGIATRLPGDEAVVGLFDHGCFIAPDLTRVGTSTWDMETCFDEYAKLKQAAAGNDLPIVFAYAWPDYRSILTQTPGGPPLSFATEADYAEFLFGKIEQIRTELGRGRRVFLVGTVPGSGNSYAATDCLLRPVLAKAECSKNLDFPAEQGSGFAFGSLLKQYAEENGVGYIDPYATFCDEATCRPVMNGRLLYSDGSHLSKDGSVLLAPGVIAAVNATPLP